MGPLPAIARWLLVGLGLGPLAVFALRRILFTLTLLRSQPPLPPADATQYGRTAVRPDPTVLILVPIRNEPQSIPGLCAALDALDYPRPQWQVALIDDGPTDDIPHERGTLRQHTAIEAAVAIRPGWQALHLPVNVGKAQALNHGLAHIPFGEIVFIFDVDSRPQPDCLRWAVRAFADARVAAVSGRLVAVNALTSPAAYYTAVESLVHQLVTLRGKDVLRLGPPLLGSNNGYRRAALAQVGGFRPGAFLEDSDLTLALLRAGYTTRFVPQAVASHRVPATLRGYIRQHIRWGRGFNDVARDHLPGLLTDPRLSWPLRLELALFAVGYLDRLALLWAVAMALLGIEPVVLWIGIGISLTLPLVQIIAALAFSRAAAGYWWRLPLIPAFFVVDTGTALWAMAATLLNLPRLWHKTDRG